MEALSRMLYRAVQGSLLEGFDVGSGGKGQFVISHILYADDTLVFCGAEDRQLCQLRCILLCFEAVSVLKVNLSKSEIVPVGEVPRLELLAAILGCKIAALPITYLGLPLGATFKDTKVWDGVIARIQRKLAGWKGKYLSKGGKMTLIRSTLGSIPTYFMSLHVIPALVAKKIEKLQRD